MAVVMVGTEELLRKLQQLQTHVPGGMGKALFSGALVLEGVVKQSMQTGKHGRTYRRGGRVHRASAAGETPAVDYGFLIASIQSDLVSDNEAQVYTNNEVAPHLEFGTAHMGARPFMRPAVDKNKKQVVGAIQATVERLIREAVK